MISRSQITEFSTSWQMQELSVVREYVQHVLLDVLYRIKGVDAKLAFKGGTALRLLRNSPRFSEDLEFTGWVKPYHVGEWIKQTAKEAARHGLDFNIVESNETSGGWFALMDTRVYDWPARIEWNVSLRASGKPALHETTLVTSPLWTSYSLTALETDEMVSEKIQALLRRKEPRDFYDLYFLVRARLGINGIVAAKPALLRETAKLNVKEVERELREFLPRNQLTIAKQLRETLTRVLDRL
ncbi:MAG: nucleotidyl transferase AbiEii/AbiGii toxin family protein [Elusimicrobia bacterium]|nr:nucleotidyl transferase AbiEii/AbiGii toxin family protein [Elusimicrobiota bacterium]